VTTRFVLCPEDRFFPPAFSRRVVAERLGIVPDAIDLAVGLSPPVARSLPALVERVVEEAAGLGFVFSRVAHTDTDETPLPLGAVDVARLARVR
jgi:hypothetical protein